MAVHFTDNAAATDGRRTPPAPRAVAARQLAPQPGQHQNRARYAAHDFGDIVVGHSWYLVQVLKYTA